MRSTNPNACDIRVCFNLPFLSASNGLENQSIIVAGIVVSLKIAINRHIIVRLAGWNRDV
jgi:hypothetical protein